MKFGILGAAHGHVFEFMGDMLTSGWECTGVVEDGFENTQKIAETYNVPIYKTVEELFVTGITVAASFAPNGVRINHVEACAKHGVHIMCDKPLVITPADLTRLKAVIEKGNIEVGLMLTLRFIPSILALRKVILNGILGDIVNLEIFNPHQLKPEVRPDWFFSDDLGGDIAVDLLTHSIDLFHWLCEHDMIVSHHGIMTKSLLPKKPNFYDIASVMVQTRVGRTGYFRSDWHMPRGHWAWGDSRVFCLGTKGYAEARLVGDPLTKEQQLIVYTNNNETQAYPLPEKKSSATKDFLNRIQKRTHCITHDDILYTCSMALEISSHSVRNIITSD